MRKTIIADDLLDMRAGFSLLELLVVVVAIAIVVVLTILIVPTHKRMSRGAATCASNLHQFDMAISMYMLDSGNMPPAHLTDCAAVAPKLFKCHADPVRTTGATSIAQVVAAPQTYSSYCYWSNSPGGVDRATGTASVAVMVICDKNGANPLQPGPAGFGGNHDGHGGFVIYNDHAARWIKTADWGPETWGTNWAGLGPRVDY